ncbi:MAG: prepilin-type N-terminal cleavage/methylation domain-containing protein, partial [Verrucomicrobiota bacterium]
MKLTPTRGYRGFSMAELMVAIVIIVALMSVLLPALRYAQKNAVWVKSSPKITAALNGFHDYATEHNGYFPPAYFPSGGESDTATGDNLEGQA